MKKYHIEYTKRFQKELKKIDIHHQKIILSYIERSIDNCIDPRLIGKILKDDKCEFIRYRIGGYRLIAVIEDGKLVILALAIGHRKEIYKKF
ncbi:MAG: type II toxin-antitoxin system RelE/ParE family toxin [Providencia heimbachae]|nr:type II toxin-antitoxin system RelE/ParE family toxin [Providencia heimbachae]